MKKRRILALGCTLALSMGMFSGCSSPSQTTTSGVISAAASAGSTAKASPAKTTDWPKSSINILVGFSAGGDTDYNAREIAKYLGKSLGQSVVVTNVSGGGGSIAASQVKNSKPDGYTVLLTHTSLNIGQAAKVANFGFKDFETSCMVGKSVGEAIIVRADSGWNTLQDMIDASKKEPNKYKMAASTGATTQYAAIAIKNAGGKFNVVDAGGAGDRIPALLGGHIDVMTNAISTVTDYIKSGKFKVLAICTPERNKNFPDIPTLKESGVDCTYNNDYTIFFPKGTDSAIVQKMSDTVKDIVENNADYAQEIKKAYMQDPYYLDTADTVQYWSDELDRLMKISDQLQGKN